MDRVCLFYLQLEQQNDTYNQLQTERKIKFRLDNIIIIFI